MSNSQESREGNPINLGELLLLLLLANQKRRKGSAELFALLRPKGATGRNQNWHWHWNWQWNWPPRRESNLAEERKKRKQKQKHKTQNANTICKDRRDCAASVTKWIKAAKIANVADRDQQRCHRWRRSRSRRKNIITERNLRRLIVCSASGTRGYIRTRPIEASEQTLVSVSRVRRLTRSSAALHHPTGHLPPPLRILLKDKRWSAVQWLYEY